ncbi:MAG: hypothetical protein ACFWTJ_14240 [Lachnoclostridium sp.]
MKLTRRKIEEGKKYRATFYRDTTRGLLYFDSEKVDSTEKVVNSMNFVRSMRGRILKHAEKGDNPFYHLVDGLVNPVAPIASEPVDMKGKDISEVINKNLTEFGKKLKAPDSIYTLEELILKIQSKDNPDEIKSELQKIRKCLETDIKNRKEQLITSIANNNIPFSVINGKLKPASRKMQWLFKLLTERTRMKPEDKVPSIEEKLDKYWERYNYKKLEKLITDNVEKLENEPAARVIANTVFKCVRDYHHNLRLSLSESSEEDQDFKLFIKEVEQHFKKYYPVKSKDSNSEYDNFLCKDNNYRFYCSCHIVKREVNRSIINQLVAGLIQQGKLLHYFYDYEKGLWQKDFLNSHGLSYIQVEEAFKKSLMSALTWGINRLIFFYYDGKEKFPDKSDILLNPKKDKKYNINDYRKNYYKRIKDDSKHFKEKLAACFSVKVKEENNRNNDSVDKLIDLVEVTRKSVANIRHNIFHYKEESLLKILESGGQKKENEKSNQNGKSIKYNVAKEFFIRDIKNLTDAFREQIRSLGILEYYPLSLLINCFDACGLEFKLYTSQNSMIPSFGKVYKKGYNLYKSDNNKHKGLHWYIEVPNQDQGRLAYKNLLQLIYYYAFLPEVKENETLITDFINSTKEWNQKEATNAKNKSKAKSMQSDESNNIAYRYEAMPDYKGEPLSDYLELLQREQMLREKQVQEKEADNNYYIPFIQDVVVRAFDAYLSRMDKYRDSLQAPALQPKEDVEKALNELICANGGKYVLKTRFQKYLPFNEIQSDKQEKPNNEREEKNNQELSQKEKGLLSFYLLLRLLDGKVISELQHQFVRYRCSLKERKLYNYNNVNQDELISVLEELEELMELVRYTIPSTLPQSLSGKKESDFKDLIERHFNDFFEEKVINKIDFYYQSDAKSPIPRKPMTLLVRSAPLPLYQQMLKDYYHITEEDINEYLKLSNGIVDEQNRLNELHKKLEHVKVQSRKISNKTGKSNYVNYLTEEDAGMVEEYEETLIKVIKYKNLRRKLTFESLYEIFQVHVNIIARLIGFAEDWERDMFFLLLALSYGKYILCSESNVKAMFSNGYVVGAITKKDGYLKNDHKLLYELCWHEVRNDRDLWRIMKDRLDIRNSIDHLNHFTQSETGPLPSLEVTLNKVRDMLCYDRKRQNAVTKTIKDMLLKEHHIRIEWESYTDNEKKYQLKIKSVNDMPVVHLKHLRIDGQKKDEKKKVDTKAFKYDKQEVWLHKGVQETAHDGNFLKCIDRLLTFSFNSANPK